jgi:hypothetical protein
LRPYECVLIKLTDDEPLEVWGQHDRKMKKDIQHSEVSNVFMAVVKT